MEAPAKEKIDAMRSDVSSKTQGLLASVRAVQEEAETKQTECKALGKTAEASRMAMMRMGTELLIEQLEQIEQQVRTLKNI